MNHIQTQIAKDNSNAIQRPKLSKNLEEFNLKQAKAFKDKPEEFLSNLIVQRAIRMGYKGKVIDRLCTLINEAVIDFNEYKEKADKILYSNDVDNLLNQIK